MKIYHITEAPKINVGDRKDPTFNTNPGTTTSSDGPKISSGSKPVTGITGTKAAFANKNGGVSKGTIVGPAKNGNPNQVSFRDSKGKTFNVSIKKLLDPKKLTPLNIGLGTSTTTAAPKADLKALPSNIDGGGEAEAKKDLKKGKSLFKKVKDKIPQKLTNWMRKHVSRILGSTAAGWVMKVWAISGIIDLYNSYFDEIYTLVEANQSGASEGKLKSIHKKMGEIRKQLIDETADLMVGSIGLAFGTTGMLVGGIVVGAVATFFTGGAAAPPSIAWNIFVGAIAAYGAYEGAMMVCKMESVGKMLQLEVSIYDYTINKLGTTWLTPDMLVQTMREVGAEQNFIDYVGGLHTNPLMQFSSPGAVPGWNSGPIRIGDLIDHKDHSEMNRIIELSGVVQETKLKKIKLDDLPDELKKLAIIGAKTIQKANKENKST